MHKLNVVVLAAGKGTRMYSDTPKVLHTLGGKSLLQHSLDKAAILDASKTVAVIGHEAKSLRKVLVGKNIEIAIQEPQLGTAHAVHQALPFLESGAVALVLYGDVPLTDTNKLAELVSLTDENTMAVLTCVVKEPTGLGRIIRNTDGEILSIVEEKDASLAQQNIQEINTGIMAIPVDKLQHWLPMISNNNAQSEYYLTDVIQLALESACSVKTLTLEDEAQACGVNNRKQLAELERIFQNRLADDLMLKGLTLRDPKRFDVRGELIIGRDIEIDVNVIMVGKVVLGDKVRIGPNCILRDCDIGSGSVIHANTVIGEARVGADCDIGPFARIRPGTVMEDNSKAGNFVELKNSHIGSGSKINHLSYIGDSELGQQSNVGAGSITCNYDGVNKHKTIIGNNVFIGSNTAMVAPVIIADGSTIAAGSVITSNIDDNQLAIARCRQKNIDGWLRPEKKTK